MITESVFTLRYSFNLVRSQGRWRFGQTWVNTLYDLWPEKADEIRGTELDPFYDDDLVPDAHAHVFGA